MKHRVKVHFDTNLSYDFYRVQPPLWLNPGTTSSHDFSNKFSICFWQFPKLVSSWTEEGVVNSTSFHVHPPPGNMFLAVGIQGGTVKIFNLPSFKIASELHFPEMKGSECSHITINHSRENPVSSSVYYRSPFRDLILTTVWSDGRIMVCQVAKQWLSKTDEHYSILFVCAHSVHALLCFVQWVLCFMFCI